MVEGIIYKDDVKTTDRTDPKQYIGMTANKFKKRYNNYVKSLRDEKYVNEIKHLKHIWDLNRNDKSYAIKWSILKSSTPCTAGAKLSNFCLEEKLMILKTTNETC